MYIQVRFNYKKVKELNLVNISLKRVIGILLIVILASVGLSNNLNIGEVKAEGKLSKTHGNINNTQDIKNFMNNYFSEKMKKYSVPGVSVVVVKDNKEMFKKGYGYSNLESKTPVDPDKTRFPAGSVSKLFTATAIMQLYEEGKIDLDKNVNDYISPYKVINKYDKPVTCRNLLTHSSGLDEESELNVSTTDVNSIKPQEYYFDTHSLKVVTEPNTVCRYSNIGYNLLGYIVEKTSGISYEKYVEEKILKPLNMSNSSVRLKSGSTSAGYVYDNDKYVETPFAYQYTSGSSGIIATAKDMENFIIENLNNGKFNDNNILNQKTLAMMHDKQFSNSKFLPGIGFGFIRSYRNGHEIIKHEGGLPGYTTTLFLIPKENLGIYVATNTLGALPFNFEEEFLNYFYPENSNNFSAAKKNANKDYSKYDGTYRSYDGTSKNNIMKLNVLFDPTMDMKIKDNKDGTLTLHEFTPAKEEITTTLVEVKNGVFLRQDGRGKFAFRTDKEGKVTYAFNDISENSFEKVNFYNEREFIMSVLSISIIMFIINPILFVILFIRRKSKKCKEPKKIRSIKVLKLLNIIIEVFNIVGVLGAVSLEMMMINNYDFSFKYLLYFFLTLLIVSTVIIPFSLALLVYSLVKKNGSIKARGYYIFFNITNLAFIWILYYFNFLGYKI
ncbi:class A beta-lactamase-related serine hydrolase [Clostridium autoethanogenum]|uniref:Class A beta-lactamase-related serine hydrolase n=1 Tax=Clostridium autoethanogenum TaxID=84023 RepID=A0A3M0T2W2_9CLOT|nr:serine hydrolase domain-containing protein [Clostridium autoethanogenum]RMD04381.1 class A beta-lactamase-related serine hydrolase [Clostridium autoethanogenum]